MPLTSKLLRTPQIIKLICEHLASEKPTLSFELNGLYPLVKCLPSSVWEEMKRKEKRYVVLRQPLVSTDCSRFMLYARRVKHFNTDPESRKQVQINIYRALQFAMHGRNLLPNVRKLTWNESHNVILPFSSMFLGPRLTQMEFTPSQKGIPLEFSVFSALHEYCPSLENFRITFSFGMSTNSESKAVTLISNSIHNWRNIKTLEVPNLSYSALLKVAQLPYLEEFKICNCKFDAAGSQMLKGGFPMLEVLKIHGSSTSDGIAFFKVMDNSPLCRLEIVLSHKRTSSALWRQIYFSNSAEIEEIATSWSNVRFLWLHSRVVSQGGVASPITLLDLLPFAEYCPELTCLVIAFDATYLPEIKRQNISGRKLNKSGLEELSVGNSPIKNPAEFAVALSGVFSSLKEISTAEEFKTAYPATETKYSNAWKEVEKLVKLFAAVRDEALRNGHIVAYETAG
ncbi:hypothetical protein BDQ17DRAFT_1335042 [Cyathus striatus]|nr:hypothetical protein BDQ17DRAFT_1335042 [Cyathus striatus]